MIIKMIIKNAKIRERIYLSFFSALIFLITFFIVYKYMFMPRTDYYVHAYWAVDFTIDASLLKLLLFRSGVMWEMICKFLSVVMPLEVAAALLSGIFSVSVYYFVSKVYGHDLLGSVVSFVLLIVGPIYLPWFNELYYIGQGTPNTWHNPTNLSVKPFALVIFLQIVYILTKLTEDKIKSLVWISLAVFLIASALAKVSFIQAMIPALGIYLIIFCIRTKFKYIKNCIFLVITFIPAVLLMFLQAISYFFVGEEAELSGGFGVSWMLVLDTMTPNAYISFLLVMLFPLVYLIFNFKRMIVKTDIQLSLLLLGVSWLEQALLYEVNRPHDGNFTWAYLLALFIIWFETVRYLLEDVRELQLVGGSSDKKQLIKVVIETVLVFVHFIFGLGYVVCLLVVPGFWI